MKTRVLVAAALSAAAASVCNADNVLWDQSALGWDLGGFYNTISGNPPFGATAYAVSDITVPAGGWTVNSVSMYFTCFDFNWDTVNGTTGRLYLQPKTGALPTVAPGGALIPMTIEILNDPNVQQAYYKVTASGLNQALAAGDWWIGITPNAPSGFFGPEIGMSTSSPVGTTTPVYDISSPAWAATGVDAAILVQGVPAPASLSVLGIAGLLGARRRRA